MAKKRPVLGCVTHAWWIFRPRVAGVEFTHPFHVPRTGPIVPMCAASNYGSKMCGDGHELREILRYLKLYSGLWTTTPTRPTTPSARSTSISTPFSCAAAIRAPCWQPRGWPPRWRAGQSSLSSLPFPSASLSTASRVRERKKTGFERVICIY